MEFQSRREFEAFGALPNDLGELYQQALQRFLAANPHVEGVWTWTQDGGPLRAGPMTLELRTASGSSTSSTPCSPPGWPGTRTPTPPEITADWARRWFSTDPATVARDHPAMALSRDAVTHGLYIGPYADQQVKALGLEPPPMMWIFEWDILTGDSAVLDIIYSVSRDRARRGDRRGRRRGRDSASDARAGRAPPTPPPGATRRCAQPWSTPSTTR